MYSMCGDESSTQVETLPSGRARPAAVTMEEADEILLLTLRNSGCRVPEEVGAGCMSRESTPRSLVSATPRVQIAVDVMSPRRLTWRGQSSGGQLQGVLAGRVFEMEEPKSRAGVVERDRASIRMQLPLAVADGDPRMRPRCVRGPNIHRRGLAGVWLRCRAQPQARKGDVWSEREELPCGSWWFPQSTAGPASTPPAGRVSTRPRSAEHPAEVKPSGMRTRVCGGCARR
jgi:hypothetical protein